MLSMRQALDVAVAFLTEDGEAWDPQTMRIEPEHAFIEEGKAVVPYNSRAFLDEGKKGAWLLGNLPVLVNLDTSVCRYMTIDEVLASPGLSNAG